nr:5528_t:CDS:2 [Entrophospora candida]
MAYRITPKLQEKINHYAKFPQTGVSLRQMVMFGQNPSQGTLFRASQFLSDELPIRLARRVKELDDLPHHLKLPQNIKDMLAPNSGEQTKLPENTPNLSLKPPITSSSSTTITPSINTVIPLEHRNNRIQSQHVALNRLPSRSDYVGIICTKTNIGQAVQEAADNAKFICEEYYGLFNAPEIQLYCPDDLNFTYIPTHLSHMLFELLKNSLRAVVEFSGDDADEYPPIKIIVSKGQEDITIKISDEGGGIPRSSIPLVWTYMYTTAQAKALDPDFNQKEFRAPMAGYGYGLPISRLYARYFGGDLKLISMEGVGENEEYHELDLRRKMDFW